MVKSALLFNERPIVVSPALACHLGLGEATVLQQVHFWIQKNEVEGFNFYENKTWVFSTLEVWQERDFPFFSLAKIGRLFQKLIAEEYIVKKKFDGTAYYTLNYDKIHELEDKEQVARDLKREKALLEISQKAQEKDRKILNAQLQPQDFNLQGFEWKQKVTMKGALKDEK